MWVLRTGTATKWMSEKQTGKTPIRLLLQKQSDLGLPCLSRLFWQAISVRNFRTFTVTSVNISGTFTFLKKKSTFETARITVLYMIYRFLDYVSECWGYLSKSSDKSIFRFYLIRQGSGNTMPNLSDSFRTG